MDHPHAVAFIASADVWPSVIETGIHLCSISVGKDFEIFYYSSFMKMCMIKPIEIWNSLFYAGGMCAYL